MFASLVKRGLVVAVAGATLGIVGPGAMVAAHAAGTYVLSDKGNFTGLILPDGTGGYFLSTHTCTLKSDGEGAGFPCRIGGTVAPNSTPASIASTISSGDGKIRSTVSITLTTTGVFSGKGPGTEADNPDIPGAPPPPRYLCKVKLAGTINFAAGTISGTFTVKESPTQP